MIRIATDSTCDLPAEFLEEYGVTVVPINIQFGTDSYQDGIDIDHDGFYREINERGILPTTSQPSAGQFEEYYRRLFEDGATDVISLHVTAKLSGTFQSSELAREMLDGQVRIHPFDSACGSAGLGFMVLEAARMAKAGQGVTEILDRMKVMRDRMNIILTLKDLRFAQMSGRVGRLQSSLVSLLDIKPIVLLQDGLLDVAEKVRTQRRAIDRMVEIMVDRVGTSALVDLAVIHAQAPDLGQDLLDRARALFSCRETFLADLTSSLVVHFGPGTLGLIAYRT
jgi:DegV family protein with EDD domain